MRPLLNLHVMKDFAVAMRGDGVLHAIKRVQSLLNDGGWATRAQSAEVVRAVCFELRAEMGDEEFDAQLAAETAASRGLML